VQDITNQARKFAKAMKAPLIFCSASHGINVLKLFKLVFEKVFSIDPDVEQKHEVGEPILEYT
jgi:GTP-binding protein of the ras superfamily involved in termination of M-phase